MLRPRDEASRQRVRLGRTSVAVAITITLGLTVLPARAMELLHDERPVATEMFPGFAAMVQRYGEQLRHAAATCETVQSDLCDHLAEWESLITEVAQLAPSERLEAVNAFFNEFGYASDEANWQALDYWATPLEFFAFMGDCEDIAIAKYFTLRGLGQPASAMRVVVVVNEYSDRMHSVLAVRAGDEILILDNEIRQILPARSFGYLVPQMSINEVGVWLHPSTDPTYARVAGAGSGSDVR